MINVQTLTSNLTDEPVLTHTFSKGRKKYQVFKQKSEQPDTTVLITTTDGVKTVIGEMAIKEIFDEPQNIEEKLLKSFKVKPKEVEEKKE